MMVMTKSAAANFSTCCRLCLADNVEFKSIFDDCTNDPTLPQKISSLLGVVISTSDKLPTLVCNVCIEKITTWQSFKVSCSENQSKLEQWISGNTDHSALTIQIKEEPIDCDGPSSVELVSGEIRVKNEILEEEYDELPPPLTPQDCTEVDPQEEEDAISQTVAAGSSALEDPDPRMCITCEKLFSSAGNRKKHEWRMHGIRRRRNNNATTTTTTTASSSMTESDFNSSSQDERSQNSIISNHRQASEPSSEEQKIQFAAGLKLLQRNSVPPISFENLSKMELSYIEKCKAMVTMYDTLTCACHNVTHPNHKRLFSHLRTLKIWFPIFTCYHCMITFTDRSTATRHYVRCARSKLETLIKLSNMKKRSEVKTRLYQNYRCTQCKFLFWFHEDFCKHVDEDHSQVVLPLVCKCGRRFTTLEDYKDHAYVSCLCEYYCDVCFTTVSSLEAFQKHCSDVHDSTDGFNLLQDDNYRLRKHGGGGGVETTPEKRGLKREYTDTSNIVSGKRKSSYKPPIIEPEIDDEDFLQESKVINPITIQRIGGTVCPICNKNYSNNNNMFRHYKAHFEKKDKETDDLYACPDCKGMFNAVEWDKHKETHQKKNCNECGKIFLFQSELDQHRSVHLNLKLYRDSKTQAYKSQMISPNPETSIMVLCEICDQMFTTKEQLKKHKLMHEAERAEEEGGEQQQQQQQVEKKYPCTICEKIYLSRGGLWEHMRSKHPAHKRKLNEYPKKCPLCEKVLSTGGAFKLHSLMHVRDGTLQKDQSESENEEDSDESYSTCKRCFKVFSSRALLKKHMRCHGIISPMSSGGRRTGQRKAWCDTCNCSFDSLAMLEEHRNSFHGDLDDAMPQLSDENDGDDIKSLVFTCDICVQTFTTKSGLKKHKEKHAREYQQASLTNRRRRNVYCKICKIGFESEQILLKHMQDEHSPKKKQQQAQEVARSQRFKCDLCPKSFNSSISLHSHAGWHKRLDLSGDKQKMLEPLIRIKEEPFDESFKCNTCGQVNANDTALQIHILERHRNVDAIALPSRCNRCNVDFSSQAEYEKHKKLHTMVEQQQQQQQQQVKQKTFNCTQCPAAFNRSESLKLHVKQFHGVQEFRCSQCDRVFDKQNSLSIHLKVHEKQKMNSSSAAGGGAAAAKQQPEVAASAAATGAGGKSHLFACSICNKGFDVPKDLRAHTIKAHPF